MTFFLDPDLYVQGHAKIEEGKRKSQEKVPRSWLACKFQGIERARMKRI